MKNKKAFTLVELLVVIAIIGILASLGISNFSMASKKGRDTKQRSDISNIQQALILYRATEGKYPGTGGSAFVNVGPDDGILDDSVDSLLVPHYLARIPEPQRAPAPGKNGYQYQSRECDGMDCKEFTLCTGELEAFTGSGTSIRSLSGANADKDGVIGDPGAGTTCDASTGLGCTRYCVTNP